MQRDLNFNLFMSYFGTETVIVLKWKTVDTLERLRILSVIIHITMSVINRYSYEPSIMYHVLSLR